MRYNNNVSKKQLNSCATHSTGCFKVEAHPLEHKLEHAKILKLCRFRTDMYSRFAPNLQYFIEAYLASPIACFL